MYPKAGFSALPSITAFMDDNNYMQAGVTNTLNITKKQIIVAPLIQFWPHSHPHPIQPYPHQSALALELDQ